MYSPESIYIHIPFCLSKCTYCDFFSKPVACVSEDYVNALCNEITWRLSNFPFKTDKINTVYIGGGTPSLLSVDQIRRISSSINLHSSKSSPVKEFTVEVNPDDVTETLLKEYAVCGVTRISCGIQSLNDKVLTFCNRRAKREQVMKALSLFEKYWDGELSLDLISGLPYETEETFMEGLKVITETKANHISLYALTLEEETPMGKMVINGDIDYDYDEADRMWIKGKEFLESKGFSQYEVSNFCKNGKMSLHNLSYWQHKSYLGLGSGGTGTIYKKDGSAFRWTNDSDLKKYINYWTEKNESETIPVIAENLDKDTLKFEFFMMGLRTIKGITDRDYIEYFQEEMPESVIKLFTDWKKKGLAEIVREGNVTRFTLGCKGLLFLNRFLEELEI